MESKPPFHALGKQLRHPLFRLVVGLTLVSPAAAAPAAKSADNADRTVVERGDLPGSPNVLAKQDGHFTLFTHGRRPPARPRAAAVAPTKRIAATTSMRPSRSGIWTDAFTSARGRVLHLIRSAESRHGLPAGLLDALVATESAYRPYAVSRAGAAGLAQLMPGTARSLGVRNSFDISANLDGGARYLRMMIDRFGSVALALAAYNAGPGAVTRSRGIPRNGETPAYVTRVLARWRVLNGL